jgi:hypothetical protein
MKGGNSKILDSRRGKEIDGSLGKSFRLAGLRDVDDVIG